MRDVIISVGKTYKINHERSGKFTILVTARTDDGTWVYADIVKGKAGALMAYNVREVGDSVTLRHAQIRSAKEVVDV